MRLKVKCFVSSLVMFSAILVNFTFTQDALAHSLYVTEYITMNVNEDRVLANTTGGCDSNCTYSYNLYDSNDPYSEIWPGSANQSTDKKTLTIKAPASLNASSKSYTIEIIALKKKAGADFDTYKTTWKIIVNDPNYRSPAPSSSAPSSPAPSSPAPSSPAPINKTYALVCDAVTNGGNSVNPSLFLYTTGDPGATCPTPSARTGFTFVGWFTSPNIGNLVTFPYIPNMGTTLYAQWQPNKYTLSCDAVTNGGSAVVPSEFSYTTGGAGVTCPTPAARTGNTFLGWFNSPSGGSSASFPFVPTSNVTLYAQWNTVTYTLTCDAVSNGGSAVTPNSYIYKVGSAGVTCPTPVERPGYTFTGWFSAANGGSAIAFPNSPTASGTVYAQWSENPKTPIVSNITTDPAVVFFCWDCKVLSASAKKTIKEFVASLPAGATDITIQITGFAQVARSATYDLKLSKARASAIAAYLKTLGVDADFVLSGKGWDDKTEKSRRGELVASYTITS